MDLLRLWTAIFLLFFLLPLRAFGGDVIKVAVIDTGLDLTDRRFEDILCKEGHKSFTGGPITDHDGHGTHIAGIIKQYARGANYCLLIYKVFPDKGRAGFEAAVPAIYEALYHGAKFINMSFGGPEYSEHEMIAMSTAPRDVTFIAAAGNDGRDLGTKNYFPASYDLINTHVVGAVDAAGIRLPNSNYGRKVRFWELGSLVSYLPGGYYGVMAGTSMAAAVHTGKLVKASK